MLDEVRGALPFSTSHWRADKLSSGATARCARCIRPHTTIMHVAMLIMIPSDWHQNSAVPEIADDEVSSDRLRRIPSFRQGCATTYAANDT